MSEKATYFSEREHQICAVAHMVEDAKTYWVTGGGSPMAAIPLAKKLYAPAPRSAPCWPPTLLTDQQKRKFVPRVDFISSPGFLDGSPGAREKAGLPRGTGPWRVVTPWATYDYDNERRLRLIAIAPWMTVD